MKIIDVHAHVIEHIRGFNQHGELRPIGKGKARWANGDEIALIPEDMGDHSFTGEALLSLMDRYGVEKAVLLQGSLSGFQNEYTYELAQKYPDRFIPGCTFDPFALQAPKIMNRFLHVLHFPVVKFECGVDSGLMGYHKPFALNDDMMLPIYDELAKGDQTLVLDIGDFNAASHQPMAVVNIAKRYPNLRIVLCHLLVPSQADEKAFKEELHTLKLDNVWFDFSALPVLTRPERYPYETARKYLRTAKEIVGADRLLWGSDAPSTLTRDSYKNLIEFVTTADIFTADETENIFYNNARVVFPF